MRAKNDSHQRNMPPMNAGKRLATVGATPQAEATSVYINASIATGLLAMVRQPCSQILMLQLDGNYLRLSLRWPTGMPSSPLHSSEAGPDEHRTACQSGVPMTAAEACTTGGNIQPDKGRSNVITLRS